LDLAFNTIVPSAHQDQKQNSEAMEFVLPAGPQQTELKRAGVFVIQILSW